MENLLLLLQFFFQSALVRSLRHKRVPLSSPVRLFLVWPALVAYYAAFWHVWPASIATYALCLHGLYATCVVVIKMGRRKATRAIRN